MYVLIAHTQREKDYQILFLPSFLGFAASWWLGPLGQFFNSRCGTVMAPGSGKGDAIASCERPQPRRHSPDLEIRNIHRRITTTSPSADLQGRVKDAPQDETWFKRRAPPLRSISRPTANNTTDQHHTQYKAISSARGLRNLRAPSR
jgi:hypothetical protein